MVNVLILGANGSIARHALPFFRVDGSVHVTLYLRKAHRLQHLQSERVRIIEGDVMDRVTLQKAMTGQDVVYANLAGNLEAMAKNVVEAMNAAGVKRLIWISSMGIYNEVPGETYGTILDPYRKSVQIIESSNLDYTILRPAWFTDQDEIDYEITQKNEPFRGSVVSRKSVAHLVAKLALTPDLAVRCSLGVNKPVR
ncbi:MAG: NAD(P)H-binding protein [Anoxybacillus sp.]|nr:NAD(P)H-binding protein [Anoxybacillus sp.]